MNLLLAALLSAGLTSTQTVERLYAVWQPYTMQTSADVPLKQIRPLLTRDLASVLERAYRGQDGAIIDADPFTDSQEGTTKATVLSPTHLKGYDVVPVRLLGAGASHTVKLRVVHQGSGWLVDDVLPGLKRQLRSAPAG